MNKKVFFEHPVSFLAEYIDFRIEGSYFTVNGMYEFLNRTDQPVNAGILFPFALPAAMIDSIGAVYLNEAGRIAWKKRERDIVFYLSLNPSDTVTIQLYYRQPLAGINSYVLTSGRSRDAPLKKAVYTLTTDKEIPDHGLKLQNIP